MLIDDIEITVKAGEGGDGKVSFIRNAQTAKGGPDGGNGGNGGNVYFIGSHNESDLRQFSFKKAVKAESGIPGKKKNLYGRNADHLTITLPLGTIITNIDTDEVIEITNTEIPILIASGGKGGRGNNEFKSATNQTPFEFEKGTLGEEKRLHLQLRLIADIGFIGLPNAGKSSLLSALTNAHPKIGAYPFTTLEPNLGMMGKIILADIPGLIEGASRGKGLGITFLRHIEKTKLLVHCIDANDEDPIKTYHIVRKEFEEYSKTLLEKPEIILLTKVDLVDEVTVKKRVKLLKTLRKGVYPVSIYDLKSLEGLRKKLEKFAG